MKNWCVLLAAGRGARSGLDMNKVFFRWQGRSVLSRCLDALEASAAYEGIVLVLSENELSDYRALMQTEGENQLVKKIVFGGKTRRESAYNGLCAVPTDAKLVSIHDAARPFVSPEIIRATLDDAEEYGSGVISTPVVDTIKQIDPESGLVSTPERNRLRAVQTPQSFDYQKLMAAHNLVHDDAVQITDDAMLFELAYGSVHLSHAESAGRNIKLTNPDDFKIPDRQPNLRIGCGYDAHRLAEGRELILCGERIDYDRGLDGHSDADVAVHALMDAILGALAMGDIGRHFPDNDPQYKGISSMLLLDRVMQTAEECGYGISNADVTIVAQKPKLAAYIPKMRANLAEAMHVSQDFVNVKATTTERMGFEGEQIGISAHSVVLLSKK